MTRLRGGLGTNTTGGGGVLRLVLAFSPSKRKADKAGITPPVTRCAFLFKLFKLPSESRRNRPEDPVLPLNSKWKGY